jgi:hypothetical protein
MNEGIPLFGQMRGDDVANEIGGGGGRSPFWIWRGHSWAAFNMAKSYLPGLPHGKPGAEAAGNCGFFNCGLRIADCLPSVLSAAGTAKAEALAKEGGFEPRMDADGRG